MASCKNCNYYEEDNELRYCNHPSFVPDPFGLDIPEDVDCDNFEKFPEKDELIIDIISKEDIDISDLDIFL